MTSVGFFRSILWGTWDTPPSGLALMTQTAMAGSILYIFHHIFVITNLYLISGIFLRLRRTTDFAALGFHLPRLSGRCSRFDDPVVLAGGRAPVVRFRRQACAHPCDCWRLAPGGRVAVILVVGVLTIISMTRLWDESFWKPASQPDKTGMSRVMLIPIAGLRP